MSNSKILQEYILSNEIIIRVVQGDLTEETTDAIVNPANTSLQHKNGISKSISRRGGPTIQQESDRWIKQHGPIRKGRATITSAGQLRTKFVIHAVGPTRGSKNKQKILVDVIHNSLLLADSHNLRSISIPIISPYVIPKDVSVRLIIQTTLRYLKRNVTTLKEIRFCNIDGLTSKVFLEKLKELLSNKD